MEDQRVNCQHQSPVSVQRIDSLLSGWFFLPCKMVAPPVDLVYRDVLRNTTAASKHRKYFNLRSDGAIQVGPPFLLPNLPIYQNPTSLTRPTNMYIWKDSKGSTYEHPFNCSYTDTVCTEVDM